MKEEIEADKLKEAIEIRITRHEGYIKVLKRDSVNPRRLYPGTYYTNQMDAEKRFIIELKQLLKIYEQSIRDPKGDRTPGGKGSKTVASRKKISGLQKKNGGGAK